VPLSVEELGFEAWPFPTVPDDFITQFLCDRLALRGKVDDLLSSFRMRGSSMINLIWADVGAGKTHTLRFMQREAAKAGFNNCLSIDVPDRPSSFRDVHDALLNECGLARILEAYIDDPQAFDAAPVLRQLCRATFSGPGTEIPAERWVSGIASPRDCRALGIPVHLTVEQCVSNVAGLVEALKAGEPPRTLILLDEFQRVKSRSSRVSSEIQNGLSSLMNRLPQSLSLLLSFAAPASSELPDWLEASLKSRAGQNHFVPIMALSNHDAKVFMRDILRVYARQSLPCEFFPFSESAIDQLIHLSGGNRVLPRDILSNASHILERYLAKHAESRVPLPLIEAKHVVIRL
jgi:hypothetical protein